MTVTEGLRMVDYQTAFNIAVGAFGFLAGVLLTNVWKEIKQIQQNERAVVDRIAQIEILVAGTYTTKEEFSRVMDKVFKKLDIIHDKLDAKADK